MFANFIFFSTYIYFFFFNDTATTEIYTLSLHDALPIGHGWLGGTVAADKSAHRREVLGEPPSWYDHRGRSEEHTSELQSRRDLVCRLLLEKKKKRVLTHTFSYLYMLYTN